MSRALLAGAVAAALALPAAAQDWAEIGALFAAQCTLCHEGEFAPLGVALDSYAAALAGGENGPVLIPGDAAASPLYQRLTGAIEPRMPLTGPPFLDEAESLAVIGAVLAEAEAARDAGA